jgi:phage gp37-like protein
MNPITTTETALIELIKSALGNKVKTVASLPGDWDANMLQRLIVIAPAVYVSFLGGPAISRDGDDAGLNSRWGIYAVTTDPSGHAARRLGSQIAIGAYEILATVIPAIHNQTVPDIGTLQLSGQIDNLFTGSLAKKNLTIYEAQFSVPLYFDSALDLNSLDDFVTFDGKYDLNTADDKIDAEDNVTLEQGP